MRQRKQAKKTINAPTSNTTNNGNDISVTTKEGSNHNLLIYILQLAERDMLKYMSHRVNNTQYGTWNFVTC
jgi:hypothetical protein